jgi:hypothetical protein
MHLYHMKCNQRTYHLIHTVQEAECSSITYIWLDFPDVYANAYQITFGIHEMNVKLFDCRHFVHV